VGHIPDLLKLLFVRHRAETSGEATSSVGPRSALLQPTRNKHRPLVFNVRRVRGAVSPLSI
jgi:hypothetical protein